MGFKLSRTLMWVGYIVGILIAAIGISFENEKIIGDFFAVGAVIFFSSLIQAFIFYACPHCGYSLMNVKGKIPEYCPKCGKELKDE